ncbi:MAG: UDP-N-acetylglucosamine 2-epimerase (non-hydrolyzing) [Patescibacteria group bacterium]
MNKKLALIFGTRPEIIKMAPFIHEAKTRAFNFFIIHTGQHYSDIMDKVFWNNLNLPDPKYNLGVGSGTHAEQVGKMMIGVEKVLAEEKPDYICVYADLNSSIAGALAAAKLGIPIIQLEAGLRSFDRGMPEEVNRLVVDRLASYFFAPTPLQQTHLENEGIRENIFVVGNLIVDAVTENVKKALATSSIMGRLGLERENYFLATIHRAGAVDNHQNFQNLLNGLALIAKRYKLPVMYPIHPRARKNLERVTLAADADIRIIDPVDYFDFLTLVSNAKLILSDSGGIQEEAAILGVPLVTLRKNTERQETLTMGSNVIAGFDPETISQKTEEMISRERNWRHPYGEHVAQKMCNILEKVLST